jgi:hypothetical protein
MPNHPHRRDSTTRRTCAFCGAAEVSEEHIFPRWLRHALPPLELFRGQERSRTYWPGQAQEKRLLIPKREIQEPFTENRVRRVCRACNHGWMNELEMTIRPMLTTMIHGNPVQLTPDDCAKLALWATKTVMLAEFTDMGSMAYSDADRHFLYEKREPPKGTRVWTASLADLDDWGVRMQHWGMLAGSSNIDDPCNVHQTTIGLGRLLLGLTHTLDYLPVPPLDRIMIPIWPDPQLRSWPTNHPLHDFMAWQVSEALAFLLSP